MGLLACFNGSSGEKKGQAQSPLEAALEAMLVEAVVRNKRRKSFEVTKKSFNNLMLQLPKLAAGFKAIRHTHKEGTVAAKGKLTWGSFHKVAAAGKLALDADSPSLREILETPEHVPDSTPVTHGDLIIVFMVAYLIDGINKKKTLLNPEIRACMNLLERAFMFFSSSLEGCIDRKELAMALKSGTRVWGRHSGKSLADQLFEQLDWTREGMISFKLFLWSMERIVVETAGEEEGEEEEDDDVLSCDGMGEEGGEEGEGPQATQLSEYAMFRRSGEDAELAGTARRKSRTSGTSKARQPSNFGGGAHRRPSISALMGMGSGSMGGGIGGGIGGGGGGSNKVCPSPLPTRGSVGGGVASAAASRRSSATGLPPSAAAAAAAAASPMLLGSPSGGHLSSRPSMQQRASVTGVRLSIASFAGGGAADMLHAAWQNDPYASSPLAAAAAAAPMLTSPTGERAGAERRGSGALTGAWAEAGGGGGGGGAGVASSPFPSAPWAAGGLSGLREEGTHEEGGPDAVMPFEPFSAAGLVPVD